MLDFEKRLQSIAQQTILCVGDLMLDEFVYGEVGRISPEAPVPVLAVTRRQVTIGGAGNVARNIASLGARCIFVGLVGDDDAGRNVIAGLQADPLVEPSLVVDRTRPTTRKMRFVSEHFSTHLLRADWEVAAPADADREGELIARALAALPRVGAVVLSDYAKGVLTPRVTREVIDAAKLARVPVIVDPKAADYSVYRGATVITPNRRELSAATRREAMGDAAISAAAEELAGTVGAQAVVVTRSEEGMTLYVKGEAPAPAHRLHQWLLRPFTSRAHPADGGSALGLRPLGGGPQQRWLGFAPQRQGAAHSRRHLARRCARSARSGRSGRGVRGGHAARTDPAGAPGRAGEGRRLRAREGGRLRRGRGLWRRSGPRRPGAGAQHHAYGRPVGRAAQDRHVTCAHRLEARVPRLSAIIITKDEAAKIGDCLDSLAVCD